MELQLERESVLPTGGARHTLLGRIWLPDAAGPAVITLRGNDVIDVSATWATTTALLDTPDPAARLRSADGGRLCSLGELLANTRPIPDRSRPHLLAPVDLQAIKACGVTFARSMLERVIEERAGGDPGKADEIRTDLIAEVGADLSAIKPGSEAADRLRESLRERGLWSQYIEVGIGPYAEVFTKSQPMSAMGTGANIGLHPESGWNNPEPEIALIVTGEGRTVGATLGNDVNLRDFEGRSALLLGKAKDNNGSCALGSFVRLFDDTFSIDDVRRADVRLHIAGEDGFTLEAVSSMQQISRDPLDLVGQTVGRHHQYPDGIVLFLGTMFAPSKDRDKPGLGFTHHIGDIVSIGTPSLGTLINRVDLSTEIEPWTFGTGALMLNLAARGLL